MKPEEIFLHWIDRVEAIPAEGFEAINDLKQVPDPPAGDSISWSNRIFLPGAGPYSPGLDTRHSYHVAVRHPGPALDVLRHEYSHVGRPLVVTEGINFVLIRFKPDEFASGPPDWPKLVEETAQRMLVPSSLDAKWKFQSVPGTQNGVVLSTNPPVQPGSIASWAERVDALVRGGSAYILCYKRRPSIVGFRHDAQWFADDFRTPVKP